MIQHKQVNGGTALSTDEGFIHKIGTDIYVSKIIMLPCETIDMYEEVVVADLPPYSEAEYKAKVTELIRQRYSADDEFALINNIMDGVTEKRKAEYATYQQYR